MPDLGDPTSYLELETGVPVFTADGRKLGRVEQVLADDNADIFEGLVVATRPGPGGHPHGAGARAGAGAGSAKPAR